MDDLLLGCVIGSILAIILCPLVAWVMVKIMSSTNE